MRDRERRPGNFADYCDVLRIAGYEDIVGVRREAERHTEQLSQRRTDMRSIGGEVSVHPVDSVRTRRPPRRLSRFANRLRRWVSEHLGQPGCRQVVAKDPRAPAARRQPQRTDAAVDPHSGE